MVYHASNDESKTKGAAILIAKNCPLQVSEVKRDANGRSLFLKGTLHNKPITLANLYAPNMKQVLFFRETLQLLTEFYSGILIVGGDFNVALSPLPYRALRAIKSYLRELTLHDAWRTLHPNERDFTFYSSLHNKYTRIDHFFISQTDQSLLSKASIDPMVLSDHNPVSITLDILAVRSKNMIWRLDNSILTNLDITQTLNTRLMQYFAENISRNTWRNHFSDCQQKQTQTESHCCAV